MEKRVVAKVMRLGMSEELGRMLRGLPAELEERRSDGVYKGTGRLVAGIERPDVEIRVFLEGGELKVSMVSRQARIEILEPFATNEQRTTFLEKAQKAISRSMN